MKQRWLLEFATTRRRISRLLVLRHVPRGAPGVGLASLLVLLAAWFASAAAFDAAAAVSDLRLSEWGLGSGLALWMAVILVFLILAGWRSLSRLTRLLADLAWLGTLLHALMALVAVVFLFASPWVAEYRFGSKLVWALASWGLLLWGFICVWRMGRALWFEPPAFAGLRLAAVVLLPLFLVPVEPIVHGAQTDWSRYDIWLLSRKAYAWVAPGNQTLSEDEQGGGEPALDVEDVFARQGALLAGTLGAVLPSPGNQPQLYFLGAAPDAAQDVFAREVKSAKSLFDERFGTLGHSAILINSYETLDTVPLASGSNLRAALKEFGAVMNRDRDVLVLFITTHGAKGILAVDLPDFPLNLITPESLAAALDDSGIKNRVLIISACHSGSFIPRLAGPNTLIMTAASAERTSFGCANGRDWTYFGDALFNHALRQETSFVKAFARAEQLIKSWEFWRIFLKPSEPQMSAGPEIVKLLDRMEQDLMARRVGRL